MKAERRHELKENSLVRGVFHFPTFWKEQGSKIMLGVIAVLLVIALYRWYRSNAELKAERVNGGLSDAQAALASWRDTSWASLLSSPEAFKNRQKSLQSQVEEKTRQVLSESSEPAQQAEAIVIQGDLYWNLSTLADVPAATTQPTLRGDKPVSEYLTMAAVKYEDVLKQQSNIPTRIAARAHLGLAAIAETKSDWAGAKTHYEAVTNAAGVSDAVKTEVKKRVALLADLQKPMLFGHAQVPPPPPPPPVAEKLGPTFTLPTSQPGTQPATLPSLSPTTEPAGPSVVPTPTPAATAPAAQPATLPTTQP